VFASAPDLDVVSAISTVTHQVIKQIPVPNPQGLDLTLGNQDLIVGTGTDQFYTIDTSQLAVVARTTLPPIATGAPPLSVQPVWPIVTSSGTILFVVNGDFPNGVAQWNPASKTIIRRPDSGVGNTAMAMRSADGTKAMFYDPLNGAASIYDAVSDKFVPIPCTYRGVPSCGRGAVNPGGTQFALCLPSGVTIYGPIGNLTQQLDTGGCYGAVYTSDGRSLLVASFLNSALEILTYDATTFQLSATAPGFGSTVANSSAPFRPEIPFTVDDTRLIYGKANRGIALDDSTNTQDIPPDAGPLVWLNFADPGEGSLTASTPVTIWTQGFTDVPDAFFGEKRGTNAHLNGLNLQVAAPPADTPGPVTIKIEEPNGILGFLPLGFSYGSVIFPQVPQAVPRDGGVTADIYGYGLGADLVTFATQVTMGAQNAQVTLHGGIETGGEDYPFALQHLQVTVPPASQSGPVNLNVTTPVGSATLPQGIHYLKSAQNVTSPDTFTDLAYDQKRNRLYLSAGDHVDVIDLASNAFLPPISLPQVNGARKAAGLTVMPNGSRLLVSNNGDRSIAVIDPDLPSNATAVGVPLALPLPPSQCTPGPGRIAATSTGKAYAAIIDNPLLGCPTRGLIELDIPSLTATVNADGPSGPYISAARNGNAVVIGAPNDVSVLDLQTNAWQYRQLDSNSNLYEYAVSGDANLVAINTIGYGTAHQDRFLILNPGLNLVGNILQPEFYYSTGYRVAGLQMHDSGSLLYAPKRQGIEIYDVHHGDQRERILVSQDLTPIEPRASQVAIDETGSRIFLIAQSGLVIVQLDSVPLSLGSVNPSTGSASGGVVVTLRGSGFEPAAQVKVDTAASVVTFVDMNTLQITTPSTPVGTVGITITNPDGQTYTLDDAYTAQ